MVSEPKWELSAQKYNQLLLIYQDNLRDTDNNI